MLLPESPLHVFAKTVREQGQIYITLDMPWPLPWVINALRTAIAWEVAANCEQLQQLVPRQTKEALNTYARWETDGADFRWLDEDFSRNATRILARIGDDISRVQPRPVVIINEPESNEENRESLAELGQQLNVIIHSKPKTLSEDVDEDTKAAIGLLGSAGLVNAELGYILIESARKAGDVKLTTALEGCVVGRWEGTRNFGAYEVSLDKNRFGPIFKALEQATLPATLPDWQSLELPLLLQEIWTNPRGCLDRIRFDSGRHLRSARNAFHVRTSIARHFLRCFSAEGLTARLDLLEASVALRNNRAARAWQLLSSHTDDPELESDAIVAAHVYGQAGHAAAKLGKSAEALELFEKNLAYLETAFVVGTKHFLKAKADLHHKLGQLFREHPELPGGLEKARQHIETTLQLQKELRLPRGILMSLSEMGELSLREGAFDKARKWFEEALDLDRQSQNLEGQSRILHQLAIMYERMGEFGQALHYVEQCEQVQQVAGISGNLRQQVRNTRERLRDMLGLDDESELDNPLDLLNKNLSEDPRAFCTRISNKARTLRQQSRFAESENLLREALKHQMPESQRQFLWLPLANLLLHLRRHDEARAILQNISPENDRMKDELAILMTRLETQTENYEQAEAIIARLGANSQSEVLGRVHLSRGEILFKQARFAEAVTEFRKARECSPASVYAMRLAMEKEAHAQLMAGEYQKAVDLAEELAGAPATGKWKLRQIRALIVLGSALLRLGQARRAAEEFERAIALVQGSEDMSSFPRVALERRAAQAWAVAGNTQAAHTHIRVAQELLEEEDAPLEQRGWVYHLAASLYRASGSLTEYESALRIAEQYAQSSESKLLQQAVVILRQGDWRQDDWSMDEYEWEDDSAPRAAIGRARRLRARLKLDEALAALVSVEQAPVVESIRREMLELKLAILLDMKEMGREVATQEVLDQLIEGRPDIEITSKLLLLRARAEMLDRRYECAIKTAFFAYEKGRGLGEFFAIARAGALLSKALSEIGRPSEAISILQQIADYMHAQGRQQFAFDAKYSMCRHYIFMRQFGEARQHLQELAISYPQLNLADWVRLQTAHAEIERIEGNSEASVARLDEVLARAEAEGRSELKAEAVRLRNTILLDSGQIHSVTTAPLNISTGKLSATKSKVASIKALRQSGRHREAIDLAEQVLEKEGAVISRTRAIVLHEAAKSYFQGKEFAKAESLCRQSLDLHVRLQMGTGTSGVRVTLADILIVVGSEEEARQQLVLALKENEEMKDERGIRICQRRLEQFSGELSSIGRPLSARDLLRHARTLRHKGQSKDAINLVAEALRQARAEQDERTEAQALGALGINSFKTRDFRQAEQYLREAVELHSRLGSANLGECVSYLAWTYQRLKRSDDARRIVIEAMRNRLGDEQRMRLQELLAKLEDRNSTPT